MVFGAKRKPCSYNTTIVNCIGSTKIVAADFTPSLLRHSGCHSVGVDGTTATDEDSLAKAMHRTAARNLDFKGYSCMYVMAPYLVYPTKARGQRHFYNGVYRAGAYGQGVFLPPWMAV